jgi:uncharacterized protein YecE (DUF72 family)
MESRLKALSPKVGAVLFQLPPQFSKNRDRLASFLEMLPRGYRFAFEFRTRAGTTMTSSVCCTSMTFRSVCRTTTTRPPRGK